MEKGKWLAGGVAVALAIGMMAVIPSYRSSAQDLRNAKSITLDQLLGRKSKPKTETKTVSVTPSRSKSTGAERRNVGAIGSILERVELTGSTLRQEMLAKPYVRYVIKGDMTLDGKSLTMPDGCILDLENGSLKNGALKMDRTLVTPIYGISKETKIHKVKVSGEYYETLVDLWGESTEPLFPWDTTAPKRVYLVDLKKFGITPGYQSKGKDGHYTDRQYDLMYNNGVGFTNAIQWAYKNGYDGIKFPKNDYCFTPRTVGKKNSYLCGLVIVQDLNKFDVDLGGGTYSIIMDSSRKSMYFKGAGPVYEQPSFLFSMDCCVNVSLHDGKLVGERKLRDYADPKEAKQEHSKGIYLGGYCYNSWIYRIEGSSFMGDVITSMQTGWYQNDYLSAHSLPSYYPLKQPAKRGKYVETSNGRIVKDIDNNEHCTISEYVDISKLYAGAEKHPLIKRIKDRKVFTINNNRGYTRIPDSYLNIDVLTFDATVSTEIPLRIIHLSYLESFELLANETGIRLQFYYDDGVGEEGHKHSVAISDCINSGLIIENCVFSDNHKGGISGGMSDTEIRYCHFIKHGQVKTREGKDIPRFLVGGTNYSINYEDSFCKNLCIHDCSFERDDKTIGKVLLGVLTLSFYNNSVKPTVTIYNNIASDIRSNVFSGKAITFMDWKLSRNVDYQTKYGCKYLTRTVMSNNTVNSLSTESGQYHTLLFEE